MNFSVITLYIWDCYLIFHYVQVQLYNLWIFHYSQWQLRYCILMCERAIKQCLKFKDYYPLVKPTG